MSGWKRYRRTATVEAKPYEPGDEDGWHSGGVFVTPKDVDPSDAFCGHMLVSRLCGCAQNEHTLSWAVQVAFISTLEGPVNIRKGSMICRDEQGNRWPVDGERFRATYEEASDD